MSKADGVGLLIVCHDNQRMDAVKHGSRQISIALNLSVFTVVSLKSMTDGGYWSPRAVRVNSQISSCLMYVGL
jgi:hypothetical protein